MTFAKGFFRTRRFANGNEEGTFLGDEVRSECKPCGLKWQGAGDEFHVKTCPLCKEPTSVQFLTTGEP